MNKYKKIFYLYIVLFVISLVIFCVIKNIEIHNECKFGYWGLDSSCTYDYVLNYPIFSAVYTILLPVIFIICFIISIIKINIDKINSKDVKTRCTLFSALCVILLFTFYIISKMFLHLH